MTDGRRWVVITGAARGIGRAIAIEAARQGFAMELVDILSDGLAETASLVGSMTDVQTSVVDLTDRKAVDHWLGAVRARRESLSGLVLNAGIGGPDDPDIDVSMEHLSRVMEVNVTSPMRIVRTLSDRLPADGSGRVVVVASILGRMGVSGFSAYCASKAAAIGFVRALALELAPRGITVNAICPGWTDTAMAQQGFDAIAAATTVSPQEARRTVEAGLPLQRIVRPEEIAALTGFLLSSGSGAMTGQSLLMCAGDLQR